jgi:signal peptidase II
LIKFLKHNEPRVCPGLFSEPEFEKLTQLHKFLNSMNPSSGKPILQTEFCKFNNSVNCGPYNYLYAMKVNKFLRAAIILGILALNIGCDQVSKSIVRKDMLYGQVIGYVSNHVTLEKVENTGAFLSLGDTLGGPVKYILLMILPLLAIGFGLVYILIKTNIDKYKLLGIILIIGGGIGNLYDRIIHGSVTDFMHIDFIIFQTGVFNVADMSIMAGMFIIIIDSYVKSRKEKASIAKNLKEH